MEGGEKALRGREDGRALSFCPADCEARGSGGAACADADLGCGVCVGARARLCLCVCVAADILALVLDVGTYNTKAGFGGDSLPKCVVPSVSARNLNARDEPAWT